MTTSTAPALPELPARKMRRPYISPTQAARISAMEAEQEVLRLREALTQLQEQKDFLQTMTRDAQSHAALYGEQMLKLREALERVCRHGIRTSAEVDADWNFARAALKERL